MTEIKAQDGDWPNVKMSQPGEDDAMLVQIDGKPVLHAIWRFGEWACIPAALLLTAMVFLT
ncbi:MAG: hypothetical protein P4L72_00175 [Parvibaculum sp.]|uniref:hypothetical protein n=1 Tax=Parvibaculum sp. TaxID=2024848 RepID=UPI002844427D|nr:hypothetical protein [Parvibaculum sp.]MDR3497621.1 hypothetical protein [Parvibaculum sp.]